MQYTYVSLPILAHFLFPVQRLIQNYTMTALILVTGRVS
jgi:hypothetical protein